MVPFNDLPRTRRLRLQEFLLQAVIGIASLCELCTCQTLYATLEKGDALMLDHPGSFFLWNAGKEAAAPGQERTSTHYDAISVWPAGSAAH